MHLHNSSTLSSSPQASLLPEIIKAELVLLAMGFLKPEHPAYPENVFVCGDAANGASLVVRAMASGKQTAAKVAAYLER